jgi:hypothetical protein
MKDVSIGWEKPHSATWQTGLGVQDVRDLLLDGVDVAPAPESTAPVVTLTDTENVVVRDLRAPTLHIAGKGTRNVRLLRTEAKIATDANVAQGAVSRQ